MRYRGGQRDDLRMPFPDDDHDTEDLRTIATHPASPWGHREAAVAILVARGDSVLGRDRQPAAALPAEHRWLRNWVELMDAAAVVTGSIYMDVDTDSAPSKCTWLKAGGTWVVRGPISVVKPGAIVLVHRGDGTASGVRISRLGPFFRNAQIGYVA